MALPATESFTNTDGTVLSSHPNWSLNAGSLDIQSNAVAPNQGGGESGGRWNADSFNNDQYAFGTIVAVTSGNDVGVGVRHSAGGSNYYGYYGSSLDAFLFKMVTGTWTQLGSTGNGLSVNDVLHLEVVGTGLTAKKNGSVDTSVGTSGQATDSSLTSGSAGVTGFGDTTALRLDNWEGGNIVPTYEQEGYRWRNDDGSETTATWAAAQDTNIRAPRQSRRRLRILINTTLDAPANAYRLEYNRVGDNDWRVV